MEVANGVPTAVRIDDGGSSEKAAADFDAVCEKVSALVSGNAAVVFTVSGCCMCHVVKQLLFGLGVVGPTVVELDRDASGGAVLTLLHRLSGGSGGKTQAAVPAVFIGGKFLGGMESVLAFHRQACPSPQRCGSSLALISLSSLSN